MVWGTIDLAGKKQPLAQGGLGRLYGSGAAVVSRNGAEDSQWHKREIQGRLQLVCQTRKNGESGLSWEAKKLLGSKRLTKKRGQEWKEKKVKGTGELRRSGGSEGS